MKNKNCVIFFTKLPVLGFCKTRLNDFLNDQQILDLSIDLFKKNFCIINKFAKQYNCTVKIYYYGEKENFDPLKIDDNCNNENLIEQKGIDLGQKMLNAFIDELKSYGKVILLGSDIANLTVEDLYLALCSLDGNDIVINPCDDGGYGLIGMKKAHDIFSNIQYSNSAVLQNTIKCIEEKQLRYSLLKNLYDIDTKDDLVRFELNNKKVKMIGAGEYNINYKFDNKFVYRINMSSQLGLKEKQIEYEYNALKTLEKTGVVPKVYNYNLSGRYIPYGNLTMEFLDGRPLDYKTDLDIAAILLSKIHNLKITDKEKSNFIKVEKPFEAMYKEFEAMYSVYKSYSKNDVNVIAKIDNMMQVAKNKGLNDTLKNACIINTELNNCNFIIGRDLEHSYIIDWEKPLIGECEQDLAHFLVPTTTNWKTEIILNNEQINSFIKSYEQYRKIDRAKLNKYLIFNTLRGITWCSMAKVEYDTNRNLKNENTLKKINKFLSVEFLNYIYKNFYEV